MHSYNSQSSNTSTIVVGSKCDLFIKWLNQSVFIDLMEAQGGNQ